MDPASAVLLVLQSQGEAALSWEKWLPLIKGGTTRPVSWRPSHGEHAEHAEQTGSFLASPTACRTAHPSGHPGRSLV